LKCSDSSSVATLLTANIKYQVQHEKHFAIGDIWFQATAANIYVHEKLYVFLVYLTKISIEKYVGKIDGFHTKTPKFAGILN
jgi:hypothetical protein